MAISEMLRVRSIITGVAGSPYYLNSYWDSTVITGQEAAELWTNLLAPATTSLPEGWVYTVEPEVAEINPSTGQQQGFQTVDVDGLTGVNQSTPQPHAVQVLFRWRTNDYRNGRRVRGHTNYPVTFVDEVNDNGGLVSTVETSFQGRLNTFLSEAAGAFRVWSRAAGEHFEVIGSDVWNEFAVLRSRRD